MDFKITSHSSQCQYTVIDTFSVVYLRFYSFYIPSFFFSVCLIESKSFERIIESNTIGDLVLSVHYLILPLTYLVKKRRKCENNIVLLWIWLSFNVHLLGNTYRTIVPFMFSKNHQHVKIVWIYNHPLFTLL